MERTTKRRSAIQHIKNFLSRCDSRSSCWAVLFLALVILIVPFFRPAIVLHLDSPIFKDWYFYLRVCAIALSVAVFVLVGKRDLFFVCLCAFCLAPLASTLLFQGKMVLWIQQYLSYFAVVLLVLAIARYSIKSLLSAVCFVTATLLVINFASAVMYPNGMWDASQYFYGNRNGLFMLALPSVGCSLMLDRLASKVMSLRSVFLAAIAYLTLCISFSATTFLALTMMLGASLLVLNKRIRCALNGYTYLVLIVVAFVAIVLLRVQEHLPFAVTDVFGKSSTFTGRTPVWDIVLTPDGLRYLLLGHGIPSEAYIAGPVMRLNAHNLFLHVWYTGGLVSTVALAIMLVLTGNRLYAVRESGPVAIAAAMLGAFLVVGLMEAEPYPAFYCALAIAYAIGSKYSEKKREELCVTPELES